VFLTTDPESHRGSLHIAESMEVAQLELMTACPTTAAPIFLNENVDTNYQKYALVGVES
jgi:hypothetical protein